jgi:hypothetical protein
MRAKLPGNLKKNMKAKGALVVGGRRMCPSCTEIFIVMRVKI